MGKRIDDLKTAIAEWLHSLKYSKTFRYIFNITTVTSCLLLVLFFLLPRLQWGDWAYPIVLILLLFSNLPVMIEVYLKKNFNTDNDLPPLPKEELPDPSRIIRTEIQSSTAPYVYAFLLSSTNHWEYIKESIDYLASTDLKKPFRLRVWDESGPVKNLTDRFSDNLWQCKNLSELNAESHRIDLVGFSKSLQRQVWIIWQNRSDMIWLGVSSDSKDLAERYIETVVRRSFQTKDALKRGKSKENGPSTFVCEVCKKSLPIKCRHKGNTCIVCSALTSVKAPANDYLDDITFIKAIQHRHADPWHQYDILLNARGYGWELMKDWADYMATADLEQISQVTAGSLGIEGKDVTQSYLSNGGACKRTPELNTEWGMLSIAGFSKTLRVPMKIVWINQTQSLRLFTLLDDDSLIAKYAETVIRRTFSTENAMKLGKPIPKKIEPVKFDGTNVLIDSKAFGEWKTKNPFVSQFELCGVLPLPEKEPTICLYEDGVKTREYTLQTTGSEDFTGKYFLISVRLGMMGSPQVPVAQIDGFVSDTSDDRKMTPNDIGYRIEGHYLACGGEIAKLRYAMIRGQDLPAKGLKYQGYTTPSNIRLIGVCPDCGKSFCFHGYAFYMMQCDVAYSDDGLDCCEIQDYGIDKDIWTYETDGKTFRYYNSFCCPHCGSPYIDYQKHPENKGFGVSGCVHLGRTHYQAK